jgi:amidase
LHGVPVLLKDNIDTGDRMTTTAGSQALTGWVPPVDSGVAARLRAAGAVLLGKANLSEWANFRSTRSSSGWSGRGGQCRNPYVLDRNPCGSSSGSGVAVSANLAAVAIGTETDGSIVCPSTANGIVGIKPTVGLVSRAGVIPISHTQDTAGPMARTVRDAVIVLGVLAGTDPNDPATADSDTRGLVDYTPFLDADGLRGMRIGVARRFLGFHEAVDQVVESAIAAMQSAGALIVDPVELRPIGGSSPGEFTNLGAAETQVLMYEFKAGLNAYLARRGADAEVRSLADLIAFNERNAETEMPYFGQERLLEAETKGPLTEPRYLAALAASSRLSRAEGIDRTMDEHQLDAIIGPTGGPAWVTDLVNGDHFGGSSSQYPAASGYPNITVPAGDVHGLPVGLSFFGRAWSEPTLIRIAYGFEQTVQARLVPRFIPTLT